MMPVIDGYMAFKYYPDRKVDGKDFLQSESTVVWDDESPLGKDESFIKMKDAALGKGLFEIESYGFGVERTLSTGSQSTGIGTGTATFNPFTISRRIDRASPLLLQMSCSGASFQRVTLALRKGSGDGSSGSTFLRFDFKLVGVKSVNWEHGDESPMENIELDYGAVAMRYSPQQPNGRLDAAIPGGWNRVLNKQDVSATDIQPR